MTPEEYTAIQEEYGGRFIATRNEKFLAGADTCGELVRILKEKNLDGEDVVLEWVRPKGRICIF